MPCDDVSEFVEVELDDLERLVTYRIAKVSCGKAVGGESLLIDALAGFTASDLLSVGSDAFLAERAISNRVEEFLSLKHLFALQGALAAYVGEAPGDKDAPFAVSTIAFSEKGVIIRGQLAVDVVTDKIRACGGCGSC
jgi:hypothetical protein